MKLSLRDKLKMDECDYKIEIKEELKNNSIVLSFAVSIIIVGIISVFYKNNTNTVLFYLLLFL